MFKAKIKFLFIAIVTVLILNGCQIKDKNSKDAMESHSMVDDVDQYIMLEEQDLAWKDNSLDALQAVFNLPVEEIKVEGEETSKTLYFAGEKGMVRFKNHYLGYKNSWSGVSGMDNQGETFAERITVDSERIGAQADRLGFIAGGQGYVAYKIDLNNSKICGQWFYFLDENFEKSREFYVDEPLTTSSYVWEIAGDKEGNLHVLVSSGTEGRNPYIIFDSEGKKIFETYIEQSLFSLRLRPLEDGRVVVSKSIWNGNASQEWSFLEADVESGTTRVFATFNRKIAEGKTDSFSPSSTVKNETEQVWCGPEGVFLYNVQEGSLKLAYKWSNHGINVQNIYDIYAKSDGTIEIIYEDTEGIWFILLKPTFEDTEIQKITFAVTPEHRDLYASAVAEFNKKYPTYNIELKDDYEEMPLLTQLGSGNGPVLIDTELTGFDALEKLWQPLDGYLEKTGLSEELYPQALAFGQIGDSTYGIVTSFSISTLLVKEVELTDWDYDRFLNAVEDFEGTVFCSKYVNATTDFRKYFFMGLSNGLQDNAYLDTEKGTVIFGTPAFERILMLSDKATCLQAEDGKTLREGKSLCEMEYIDYVEKLVGLRMRLESGGIYAAGYPTQNGARHLLEADAPIAIRSTSTEEEKQIAYTFFKILLSHNSAMQLATNQYLITGHFSVRKDIVKEQLEQYARVYQINGTPAIDLEKESSLFKELLANSVVKKDFPTDLQEVFDEELGEYLEGEIPGELLDSRLKSRVGLYMDENY